MKPRKNILQQSYPLDHINDQANRFKEVDDSFDYMDEIIKVEDTLMNHFWDIHTMSPLYHFSRKELTYYVHDLIKHLRMEAAAEYHMNLGYNVGIENTQSFLFIHIKEESSMKVSREEQIPKTGIYMLYFPISGEPERSMFRRGSTELSYVFLKQGDPVLFRRISTWFERKFQCVIDPNMISISAPEMRRFARNWVVCSIVLQREHMEESNEDQSIDIDHRNINSPHMEESNEDQSIDIDHTNINSPLIMKFIPATNKQETTNTTNITNEQAILLENAAVELIIPWIRLEKLYISMEKNAVATGKLPEIIQQIESNYFKNLPTTMPPMEFVSLETNDVVLLASGKLQFLSKTLVHPILHGLLDLLAIHQVIRRSRRVTML